MSGELVLSNSRANTFKRCQKQYDFKYVRKLKPKDKALPLMLGDWLHQLQMVHYDQQDWKQRHLMLKAYNWDPLFDEEKEDLGELPTNAERLFKGYLAHWAEEDKNFRVVDTEINEVVELPNGQKLIVIVDMVVEDIYDGGLWPFDHKWVSRFFPDDFLLIDSQLALYFWALDERLGYHNLRGAVLNESITKPPTLPKFLEKSGRFEMRKNIHCDAYTYFSVLKRAGVTDFKPYKGFLGFLKARHNEWWRRTRLPRDKAMVNAIVNEMMATGQDIQRIVDRGVFTRTSRKECQWDCDYLEPCAAQLQGADISSIIKLKYEISQRPDEEDIKRFWPSEYKMTRRRARG